MSTVIHQPTTLGQSSITHLVESASRELSGLDAKLTSLFASSEPVTGNDLLVVNAYLGSIGARLIVAADKLNGI